MQVVVAAKDVIIDKFEKIISLGNESPDRWRIGIGSLERASLLNVGEEIFYQKSPIDEATEIMYHFIGQGVKTCNMNKQNFNGIYLYR